MVEVEVIETVEFETEMLIVEFGWNMVDNLVRMVVVSALKFVESEGKFILVVEENIVVLFCVSVEFIIRVDWIVVNDVGSVAEFTLVDDDDDEIVDKETGLVVDKSGDNVVLKLVVNNAIVEAELAFVDTKDEVCDDIDSVDVGTDLADANEIDAVDDGSEVDAVDDGPDVDAVDDGPDTNTVVDGTGFAEDNEIDAVDDGPVVDAIDDVADGSDVDDGTDADVVDDCDDIDSLDVGTDLADENEIDAVDDGSDEDAVDDDIEEETKIVDDKDEDKVEL